MAGFDENQTDIVLAAEEKIAEQIVAVMRGCPTQEKAREHMNVLIEVVALDICSIVTAKLGQVKRDD